jgi:hypothetical protein
MVKAQGRSAPVSIAMNKQQRDAFAAEARRLGLGLSTTIRTLAMERIEDLRQQRQRERALRWQGDRMRALADRVEREGFDEATQGEVDAIFADALSRKKDESATD